MRLTRPPYLLRKFYSGMVWRVNTRKKKLFLTFDDGPDPDVTPAVLEVLSSFGAKSTFFCIGRNAGAHSGLLERIRKEGHAVGNHSWDHPNGWRIRERDYTANVRKCDPLLQSNLFRPPYGRITRSQARRLSGHYSLIMWDVLSWDFEPSVTPAACVKKVCASAREGSIVVFHDSSKAKKNVLSALPEVLTYFGKKGFVFEKLENSDPDPDPDSYLDYRD